MIRWKFSRKKLLGWLSGARVRGVLRVSGPLAALALASGCVNTANYEEARSAAAVEREGRRRTQAALEETQAQLARANAALLVRESAIVEQQQKLAEGDLDLQLAHKQRDENGELVSQLRGELARVGDHLRSYSEEKQRLAEELRLAERDSRAAGQGARDLSEFTDVVRDLSLLEADRLRSGAIELMTLGQQPALKVGSETLARGDQLSADGTEIVKALAKLATLHKQIGFVISEQPGPRSEQALPGAVLLRRVANAMSQEGIEPERVTLDVAEAGAALEARAGSQPAAEPEPAAKSQPAAGPAQVVFVIELDDSGAAAVAEAPAATPTP